jgi:exopolyphosphatase / guanosine-5'-triphosphate,3'-diphosphate pyrophosphatase
MPIFAAIDIGANSVRLKVARLARRRLEVIHEDREVTRLGAAVFRSGQLSPEAMAHTVEVLQRFFKATQRYGTDAVRVVATSALRDARNAHAFTEWVKAATGWKVEVISGLEEGRLIHLGLVTNARITTGRMLLVDLGGGSCELTFSSEGHIRQMFSLPLGAVRLTGDFLPHDPPKKKEMRRLNEFIGEELSRIERKLEPMRGRMMIATSGTAAALAAAAKAKVGRGLVSEAVSRASTVKLARKLAQLSRQERAAIPGIGPRRSEIIVAGSAVFARLLESARLSGFRYSPLGLRDGLLAQMAADYDRKTPLRRRIEADRRDALLNLVGHYDVDLRFAEHVRDLALQLFSVLKPLHNLKPEYGEWLAAAAMVHEVGAFINRSGRRRHTHYIVAHSDIFGYSVQERHVIAAITRYLGKSRPGNDDALLKRFPPAARNAIRRAVVLLRMARALDQGRRGAVRKVQCSRRSGKVVLRLATKRGGADLELWALARERSYFREVFGRDLLAEEA